MHARVLENRTPVVLGRFIQHVTNLRDCLRSQAQIVQQPSRSDIIGVVYSAASNRINRPS